MPPDDEDDLPDPPSGVCVPANLPGVLPQSRCPIGADLTHIVQTGQLPLSMDDYRWLLSIGVMT